MNDPIVIVAAARTPMGGFNGELKDFSAAQLGGFAIRAAVERAGLAGGQAERIDEVLMGNCLLAGQGQAPARQASIAAGLPKSVGAVTLSKMCGSGMKAIMLAHDMLAAGSAEIMVAGGMESMSNAPYLLPRARQGYRMGHQTVLDHMFCDGLEDAYTRDAQGGGRLMGTFAEECASAFEFTRKQQDDFAIASLTRAQAANREGWFAWETTPIALRAGKDQRFVEMDEQPFKANLDKIPTLKPVFKKDGGTVTAANSSSLSDGAAALVLMRQATATKLGCAPLARIVAQATFAQEPNLFPTAPVGALRRLFDRTGWASDQVDLYEINEAFAVVTMAAMREHKLRHERVNIHGGACALGHPIGASGARIVVTLIGALRRTGGKRGVATLCIGGGEATALGIELP